MCYASWKRPFVNVRPRCDSARSRPRALAADLYLIHWIEAKGYRYDMIADENLHAEGTRCSLRIAWSSPARTRSTGRSRCWMPSIATSMPAAG